jgi:uncharacterized protein with beta-barrel porin domain
MRRWSRAGLASAIVVLCTAALTGEAVAQCPGGGPFVGPAPVCPVGNTLASGSGNSGVSGQAALFDVGTQFMQRLSALASFRTAASNANNPQGGGAEHDAQRYRAWIEGYGLNVTTDAQGAFHGDRRKTYGGVAGLGMTLTPEVNVGLSVDRSQSLIGINGADQNGRIDLTQVGALGSIDRGPWNLSASLVYGFGEVRSSRFDPGGISNAAYNAQLWAAMAELSYYWALPNNSRLVPRLTLDWLRSHTDAFVETGGATPITGSDVTSSRVRVMIGAELGHSWLVDRRVMDVSVYARLVDNVSQDIGSLQVALTDAPNVSLFVAGVRESTLGADAGAMLSAKVTDTMRLYLVYDGRYRSNLMSHGGTAGAEFRF